MRTLRRAVHIITVSAMTTGVTAGSGVAQTSENFSDWPVLKSTFPSTSGGGMMIKGYDPVVSAGKCYTTFMAVPPGDNPPVYPAFIEFDAVSAGGGTLCTNGKWKMMDGSNSGTTPFRIYYKDGTFYGR
jgi:hypothetical protein